MYSTQTASSKKRLWASWIMGGLPALFLLLDASMKFVKPAAVVEGSLKVGFPNRLLSASHCPARKHLALPGLAHSRSWGNSVDRLFGRCRCHPRAARRAGVQHRLPDHLRSAALGGLWLRDHRPANLLPFRHLAKHRTQSLTNEEETMKHVTAFIHFDGNCRQAMSFYQQCLGLDLQFNPYPDAEGKPSRLKR